MRSVVTAVGFGWVVLVFGLSAAQTTATGEVNLTATSANVTESGSPVKIRILRWSTDEERTPVVAALSPPAPVAAPAEGAAAPSAGAGDRGGAAGRGGRGAAGRGAAGRGGAGRGRAGRGGPGGAGAALDPVAALTAAIGRAPTIGYIWTNDVTGYAIKYAWHASLPDGGERIILATDRRLGAYSSAWKPVARALLGAEALGETAVRDYEFTLIEIRLDSKGLGEGKTSLSTKVIVDNDAGTVALDNDPASLSILQNVKR